VSNSPTKYLFVTGGVTSSLGKGIISASLGKLLTARGYSVTIQKLDPYINIDPGTMNPYEHGECYVTDDGAETDLDLGHYERFMDVELTQANNVTTGRIYQSGTVTLNDGDYLGKTIVENGRLEVVGTLAHSEILVSQGGILGGTGQIGGEALIVENANLCPGSQSELGSLTFMANLKLNGNLEVAVDPDQLPNCDRVNVSGVLEVEILDGQQANTGTIKISNIGSPYASEQVFQIFNKPLIHGASKAIDPLVPALGLLWDNRLSDDGRVYNHGYATIYRKTIITQQP
jgi:hypothetical protein